MRLRRSCNLHAPGGFTLVEVVIALAIASICLAGIIYAYVQSSFRAEWAGYSLAAQALAVQQLEQARCADWDVRRYPAYCELTNIPLTTAAMLDLPVSGTNVVWATNYTTITSLPITNTLNASVYMVRVDTVWPFAWSKRKAYFTNTVVDYFAPD